MKPLCDIGLVGLAVMGENLVMNMVNKGFQVAVFNRTTARVDEFLAGQAAGKAVKGAYSLAELAASLERPRRVMLMVKAGKPVDDMIEQVQPYLESGDILIDGGNSFFEDTRSLYRNHRLAARRSYRYTRTATAARQKCRRFLFFA